MDQAKTGRFIAARRKELGLTQRQLAEQLSISDKTVSKWECGGGLPEVGLMLPLCGALGVSVNELLAARLAVLALALVTAAAGIGGAAVLDAGAGWYQCPGCGALFVPTMAEYVKGYHTLTRRKLTCPECGRRGMCRRRVAR